MGVYAGGGLGCHEYLMECGDGSGDSGDSGKSEGGDALTVRSQVQSEVVLSQLISRERT